MEARQQLSSWLGAEYKLYNHFKLKFEKQVKKRVLK